MQLLHLLNANPRHSKRKFKKNSRKFKSFIVITQCSTIFHSWADCLLGPQFLDSHSLMNVILNVVNVIFSSYCSDNNATTEHTSWTLEMSLQRRVMAAFLELGNWPPRESVERYLLCFHCSIRLCMNFSHLLAYWAKSSLNTQVFIMAVESGLTRGHPWCSTGCLGKTGIRKLLVTGHRNQQDSKLLYKFGNRLTML